MKRIVALALAVIAAASLTVQSAEARGKHHKRFDERLEVVALGTGAAATAGYFAINNWKWNWQSTTFPGQWGAIAGTTLACAAVSPMIGTVVVGRELTQREGHILVGSCLVPFIGGFLVNAAYEAHPEWEPRMARHHKKHKM